MKKISQPAGRQGFTLIELLVVIAIIGVLISISVFSLSDSRKTGRDGRRKADLELIRSGVELYKADCNSYPLSLGTQLKGSGTPSGCSVNNIYIKLCNRCLCVVWF